jgi:hypothetical protein
VATTANLVDAFERFREEFATRAPEFLRVFSRPGAEIPANVQRNELRMLPPPPIILLYILLALVVAILGRNRKFGFWGYFFCSILFTPFLGILFVIASEKIK